MNTIDDIYKLISTYDNDAQKILRAVPDSLWEFILLGYWYHDSSHGIDHVIQVYVNAVEIIKMRGITLTSEQSNVLPYLVLCHDVLDHKQPADKKLPESEVREFYQSSLGNKLTEVIIYIHDNCSWSKRSKSQPVSIPGYEDYEVLRLILQDADWLEAIGLGGIKRCRDCQKTWFPEDSEEQIRKRVIDHIDEKLLHVYTGFNFDETRLIAGKRDLLRPMIDYRLNQ